MKKVRLTALAMALLMMVSMLSACGGGEFEEVDVTLKEVTTTDTYPQDTDVTLKYWGGLHSSVMAGHTNFADTELHKYLVEATGINIEYEHPVSGQEKTAFNIMQSSDDLPDIIAYSWSSYAGGPQKAIDEGVIIPLNDYIDKVSPNFKKILDEHPDYAADVMTDAGNLYQYPFIRGDEKLLTYITYGIRKDLLDKAGLDVPVTLADWEEALYAFRDMGVEVPYSTIINNGMLGNLAPFMGCFGITGTFFHDENGVVKYGPYEKEFGDWLKLMKKWYDDGILDKDFADDDAKRRSALVTNGRNGAITGSVGAQFGSWIPAILPESGIEYVPTTVPVLNEGDTPMWTQKDRYVKDGVAISATSKYKELAARFIDFGYSEEGHMIYNFGKEGVSYNMINGFPTYNPDLKDPAKNGGVSFSQALAKHVKATYAGPFVQDPRYIEQFYDLDVQKKALTMWNSDTLKYKMPILQFTPEEQKIYTDAMTPINTYGEETVAKLISGKLDISQLDEYYAELKRLGIEDVIKVEQAAYDRYLERLDKLK